MFPGLLRQIFAAIAALGIGLWLDGIWILVMPGLFSVASLVALQLGWPGKTSSYLRRPSAEEALPTSAPTAATATPVTDGFVDPRRESTTREYRPNFTMPAPAAGIANVRPLQRFPTPPSRPPSAATFIFKQSAEFESRSTQSNVNVPFAMAGDSQVRSPPTPPTPPATSAANIAPAAPIVSAAAKPQGHAVRSVRTSPDAEHYRRHAGVPGFLYAAQNDCHQPDLFKVGYTTLSPSARVISLNDEHAKASDVGVFTLVHSVPVTASYDTEQALFDALTNWRLAPGREYFVLPAAQICAAMDAAVHLGRGDLGRLSSVVAAFPNWAPAWQQRAQHLTRRDATQKPAPDWGWIFVCRNQCHRGSIRRLGSTHADPMESVNALNVAQRRLTSQIGFFNLELCISVRDPPAVLNAARCSLQRFLIHPRRRFVDSDLAQIEDALRAAAREHAAAPISAAVTNVIGDLTLTEWTSPMDTSLAPWIFGCPSCGVSMRLTGKIGANSILPCTACSHPLALSLSSRGATAAAVGQSS